MTTRSETNIVNCKRFEIVIMDLARDVAMAAESQGKLGEHIQDCPYCAAQVANQRSLTAGLRTLAGSSMSQAAPPCVEAALMTAFRRRAVPAAASFGLRDLVIRSGIGLAVNMEIADQPVRADVLLGNDGVPRSIRLIDNSVQSG